MLVVNPDCSQAAEEVTDSYPDNKNGNIQDVLGMDRKGRSCVRCIEHNLPLLRPFEEHLTLEQEQWRQVFHSLHAYNPGNALAGFAGFYRERKPVLRTSI